MWSFVDPFGFLPLWVLQPLEIVEQFKNRPRLSLSCQMWSFDPFGFFSVLSPSRNVNIMFSAAAGKSTPSNLAINASLFSIGIIHPPFLGLYNGWPLSRERQRIGSSGVLACSPFSTNSIKARPRSVISGKSKGRVPILFIPSSYNSPFEMRT